MLTRTIPIALTMFATLVIAQERALAAETTASTSWIDLLDPELTQWETWMGVPHSSTPLDWDGKSDDVTAGGRPIGLGNDPLGVFSCRIVENEPVLFVSGQIYGGLTTIKNYCDYRLQVQVRWGVKKWPPRANAKRDSGVLLHCVGPHGAFWGTWMRCLECQIQEGDFGDFIALAGTNARVSAVASRDSGRPRFSPGGQLRSAGLVSHGPSVEAAHGEWNEVELYALGDSCVFLVNNTPVMALQNTTQRSPDGQAWTPLTGGRIQIQSEGAEIEYRRVRIRSIAAYPDRLAKLFKDDFRPVDQTQ